MSDRGKKALIIGGGIAGLCAGVYLRKTGFDTEILEMHSVAGGLATSWKRRGYTFENCIHWLVGSKEGGDLNDFWNEVFPIDRLRFFEDDVYQVIERHGRRLTVYKDPDRLEREFMRAAPNDTKSVKEFIRLVMKFQSFHIPGGDTLFSRALSLLKALPYMPDFLKYSKLTMGDFGERFDDPLVRSFFTAGLKELSFLAILFTLAWMAAGNAGYPIGGSAAMIGPIVKNYEALGGAVRFEAEVKKIITGDGRVSGVLLANGERIPADVVVSAADGHATLYEMLGGRFLTDKIGSIYDTCKTFPSYLQICLGVGVDMKGQPGHLLLHLNDPIIIDPETRADHLTFRIFHFDPTFAPPGKTAVVCFIPTYNHDYWSNLRREDETRYTAEKQRIADEVIAVFEKRFPSAKGRIEVVDTASPATVIRYTGNWKGSMEGWLLTPETGLRQLPSTLPGLKGFYMVGQWISPGGGLPAGVITARKVTQEICRDFGILWKA